MTAAQYERKPSQAALVIAQMRAFRARWGSGMEDPDRLLGLQLDDVVLGADPAPPLEGETRYRRWVRQQKEAREAAARVSEARAAAEKEREARWIAEADRHRTVAEEQIRLGEERRTKREEQRKIEVGQREIAVAARWREQIRLGEERRTKREEQRKIEVGQRELAVAARWREQIAERAVFENRFAIGFMEDTRRSGWVFDLCSECGVPFWILHENLVNWSVYWRGASRCMLCYCPPLTERVRSENPQWSPARVSHEVVTSIGGSGKYAWAPELVAYRSR
jgi:hypothetical protein